MSTSIGEPSALSDKVQQLQQQLDNALKSVKALRKSISDAVGNRELVDEPTTKLTKAVDQVVAATNASIKRLAQLQQLHDAWTQRFGHGSEFESALLSVTDVVAGTCVGIASVPAVSEVEYDLVVIDEASKATPTEALVPMARGKRWVLVGDQRQLPPFADENLVKTGLLENYDLERFELQDTLFNRLITGLRPSSRVTLTVQHRMVQAIGDLISECFYDGVLQSTRNEPLPEALGSVLHKPITWFSTSKITRRKETRAQGASGGNSFANLEEAYRINLWLEKLENRAREVQPSQETRIAVITGYSAQKEQLIRIISPSDMVKWQQLRIEVNSVDAFQGREADVVVYSVTRSNDEGDLGFLLSHARLNVALSRGRDALVVFGDLDHCVLCHDQDNPFRLVIRYIEDHPDYCIVEMLS